MLETAIEMAPKKLTCPTLNNKLSGSYAALLTPFDPKGKVDYETFEGVIDFVLERGVDGVVVGGGTAEYPRLDLAERKELTTLAVHRVQNKAKVLANIGASSLQGTLWLGEHAAASGSHALLLTMPYFFRYEQHDLKAYCETVCRALKVPCLLYNLPSFTNPLDAETAIELLLSEENLIGIKDSSGDRRNLLRLAQARRDRDFSLMVGDDGVLFEALTTGWDGAISGLACFVPELIVSLFRSFQAGNRQQAWDLQKLLNQMIEQVLRLPIPWGVRVGLAARGLPTGDFALPLSALRRQQVAELHEWLSNWLPTCVGVCQKSTTNSSQ